MKMTRVIAAAALLGMVATPVMASAAAAGNSANALSLRGAAVPQNARVSKSVSDANKAAPGGLLAVLAAVAVGAGIYFAVDGGSDDNDSDSN